MELSLLLICRTSYCCTNPIRGYFSWFNFLRSEWNIESENLPDEVMNLGIFTIWLALSGCWPHTSSIWPWSGAPKVHLYNTFLGSLRQHHGGEAAKIVCSLSRGRVPDSAPWIFFIFYKYCFVYWTTLCLPPALSKCSRTLSAHWRSTSSTPISYFCKVKLGWGLDCMLATCMAVAWVMPLQGGPQITPLLTQRRVHCPVLSHGRCHCIELSPPFQGERSWQHKMDQHVLFFSTISSVY